jgi:hypothetical protein
MPLIVALVFDYLCRKIGHHEFDRSGLHSEEAKSKVEELKARMNAMAPGSISI